MNTKLLGTSAIVLAFVFLARNAAALSLCEVAANRPAFDHREIEITAFLSHAFEDFTLFDPACGDWSNRVWVEYGGTSASGTIYCCGVGDERTRKKPLEVDGVGTTIVNDKLFERFDALVQREPDSVVHATLRGRFFAGEKQELPDGTTWTGFGHFGIYSLFVVEQVVAVEPHDLKGIDYRAYADSPHISGVGCYSKTIDGTPYADAIDQQKAAESGPRAWAFDDPARVAAESLSAAIKSGPVPRLKIVHRAAGRMVFEGLHYRVVVSKPYWLTFYAARRPRIAWTTIAMYESGCGE